MLVQKIPALQGNLITSIFFEASTRTRNSFELAAKRLSADVQSFSPSSSSFSKGETLIDTASNIFCNGFRYFNNKTFIKSCPFRNFQKLDVTKVKTSVLNAGDGLHSHPSQGLLDIYTLIKFFSPKLLKPEIYFLKIF